MKDHSLGIIKKKSSSGCLIIKKKIPLDSSNSLYPTIDKKKRLRVTDYDYDDDPNAPPEEFDKFHYSNRGFTGNRELETYQKNRINVREFDDSHSHESRKIRKHRHWQNGDQKDSGSGSSSTRMIYDDNNSRRDFRSFTHEVQYDYGESHLPLVSDRQQVVYDKPIRLQGKNGVLKVMVKKHRHNYDQIIQSYDPPPLPNKDWEESRPPLYKIKQPRNVSQTHHHWEATEWSSSYSVSKYPGKPVSFKSKQKVEIELTNDETHTPLPVKSSSRVLHSSSSTENKIQIKNVTPDKGSETKVVKRGTGTEKQLLREKIRSMLLGAGWTIDYRPRRNRDYLDAVYINPSGTAFWSIIKAYEALQKEEKPHSQAGAPADFTPLPVETLSKLTRQTRKKIERDLKKKSRDETKTLVDIQYDRETPNNTTFGMVQACKSNKLRRRTLLIRSSQGEKSENNLFAPYSGKRTLLSWLIDSGMVQMGEKVQYMNHKNSQVMQEGWITKEGIRCGCCSKILTVLKFELHAGSKLQQPFSNIYVQSGRSLMQCQIDAWNNQGELQRNGFHAVDLDGEDPNDDTCGLCADGGDLICCDGCPSTFHQLCLGIQMLPQGDWHCPNCSCKYCEMATESPLLKCCLCEKKYHESCSKEMDEMLVDLNLSFCGPKCLEVYSQLQKVIGVKHEQDSGFSWSLIHRSDVSDTSSPLDLCQRVESNSKLAVAMSVIDECFLPVTDRRSGINLIHNTIYNCGSNLSRLNYSGFLTAILERDDEIICAASIRIHGTQLAEMPFIGTRHIYRRQGMCRRLLSAIESMLSSLHIDKLIIPAIAEHMHTWTDVFGFSPLDELQKQELRSMNMLVFPGTDMLNKPLKKCTPLLKMSIEMCKRPEIEKCEADLPNDEDEFIESIAPTDSASQALSVSLNDDCSIDPNISGTVMLHKPVEKGSPFQKWSTELCIMPRIEKSEPNSPDDEKEFIEHIAPMDSAASRDPSVFLDDGCSIDFNISVKNDNSFNVACDSTLPYDGGNSIMQNGEESTENIAYADAIATKLVDINGDSKVVGCAVGNFTSAKTGDATQDPDNPLLPKESEELVDLLGGKEPVSVPVDSDFKIQVIDDKIEAGFLNDVISSDIHEPEQQLSVQVNNPPGIGEKRSSF